MKRAIGIDIGGSSVKVAELLRTRSGVEAVSFFSEKLDDGGFSEKLAGVLRERVSRGVKVVSAITAGQAILRSAVVPFSDERKIREIVKFEAERYLPFPAEEAVVDFYVIGPGKEGSCRIMLVAVRKAFMEKHLSLLNNLGVEPAIIDVDSMALLNLVSGDPGTVAVIDLGADATSISVVSGGLPLCQRSIPVGGNGLTRVLADTGKISWDEAERKKAEAGVGLPAFEETVASIVNEVKYTIGAFSLQEAGSGVEKVLLSGGGARLKDLPGFLTEKLGLDVFRVDPLREMRHDFDEDLVSEVSGCGDVAIGLALRGIGEETAKVSVDLKKGMREKTPQRKSLVTTFVLVSLVFLLAMSTHFLRIHWKRAYLSSMDKQIRTAFQETFPRERGKARSSLEMISLMRHRADEGKHRLSALGEIGTGSILEMLREFTVNVPDSIGVDITKLRLDGNSVQVDGETGSFETIENLKQNFSASDYFTDVRVREAVSLEGRVKFRLDITR